jgi:hypothetical protein
MTGTGTCLGGGATTRVGEVAVPLRFGPGGGASIGMKSLGTSEATDGANFGADGVGLLSEREEKSLTGG